ncbi:PREDICTED: ankyrin repeat domain-containing protein 26-like [Elephantulus edwardii]|uniref:ankyrin repeat domain-containing protein 26-like n=1 Tax=Elephantulus edwardii TaxID=28737 RepID=UPI0003F0CEF5|nr:PREDICTED: ankyrin repeat domain-containing protein 26-like [Elephantulus edwardii]
MEKANSVTGVLQLTDDYSLTETDQLTARPAKKISNEMRKIQEQINSVDNSDNFTQSSRTALEDCTSFNSDSSSFVLKKEELGMDLKDSVNLMKLQHTVSSCEEKLELQKYHCDIYTTKNEKFKTKFSRVRVDSKQIILQLEHQNKEWEREVNNLRFALKQEEEKRRNADMLCEKIRHQFKKKEEQYSKEVEMKQQLEITLRMLDVELKTVRNNLNQVITERNDMQKQLSQEQNAKVLQDGILSSHICKKETEMVQKKIIPNSEVCDSNEKEKDLVQTNQMLQNKITVLTLELDALKNQCQVKVKKYAEDIEIVQRKNYDLQKTLQQSEETLANTVLQHCEQLNVLTTENTMLKSRLKNEKQNKERLETEIESYCSRLTAVTQDHYLCQTSKRDLELAFQRAKDEWFHLQDKMNFDLSNLKDNNESLCQQLSKIESKFSNQKLELQQTKKALREKTLALERVERDLSQPHHQLTKVEPMNQNMPGKVRKYTGRQECSQGKPCIVHSESTLAQQQLDEAFNKGDNEEKLAIYIQDQFHDSLKKLQVESEKQSLRLKERNKELTNECKNLKEKVCQYEKEKAEREVALRQLQQELVDTLKKQSVSEALLEVLSHYRSSSEGEKRALKKKLGQVMFQMDDLKANLRESSSEYIHLDAKYQALQQEFLSLKTVQKKCQKLGKNKKKLEQEVVNLRSHLEGNMIDHSQVEQYKQAIEARARQEIEEKLKEVNLFLQTQAISQEYLEKLRETNNVSARTQMELRIKELETELCKIKTCQEDFNKAELKKYKQLYQDELKVRKAVSSKLNSTNEKLAEINTKLLIEKQQKRSLLSTISTRPVLESPYTENSSNSLQFSSSLTPKEHVWITPKEYVSIPTFLKFQPSSNSMDSYLTEMRQELDKTITRELQKGARRKSWLPLENASSSLIWAGFPCARSLAALPPRSTREVLGSSLENASSSLMWAGLPCARSQATLPPRSIDAAEFESASYRTSSLGYSNKPSQELLVQASEEYVQDFQSFIVVFNIIFSWYKQKDFHPPAASRLPVLRRGVLSVSPQHLMTDFGPVPVV